MIFLEKGSLNKSWSSRLFSITGFNSNSPTSIPVILIWESYPILHPPPHILSLSRLSFLNATVHARMHATYRRCFLKPSRILSVFSNPWEIGSLLWLNKIAVYELMKRKKGVNLLSPFPVNLQPRGERSRVAIARLAQGVQQAGHITDQISSTIRDKQVNYWSKSFYNCRYCVWFCSLQND